MKAKGLEDILSNLEGKINDNKRKPFAARLELEDE